MVSFFTSPGPGLILLAIGTVLFVIETLLYFGFHRVYFQFAAPLHVEEWQSRATPDVAADAIRSGLAEAQLTARMRGDVLCIRRPWWAFSAWPRAVLRIEAGDAGAVLRYEMRPFLSLVLFGVACVLLAVTGPVRLFWIATLAYIIVTYVACWGWELRVFGRLARLRKTLRDIGVQICNRCGYDLHLHDAMRPCPECGARVD